MIGRLSIPTIARWCARYLRENFGYAFYAIWTFSFTDEFGVFGLVATGPHSVAAHLASMLAIAAAGLAVCLLARRLAPLQAHAPLIVGAGVLGSTGMAMRVLISAGIAQQTLFPVAFAASGLASGAIVAAWLERFLAQGLHSVVWSYFTCVLAGALACCVLGTLPPPIASVAFALMPIASALSLLVTRGTASQWATRDLPQGSAQDDVANTDPIPPKTPSGAVVRVLAVIALSCLATQAIRMQAADLELAIPSQLLMLATLLPMTLAAAVATVVATYAYAFRTSAIFYLSIPATAIVALLFMFRIGTPTLAIAAATVASMCDQLVTSIAICLFYDFRGGRQPLLRYIGALVAAQVVGTSLGVGLMWLSTDPTVIGATTLTCMIAMALVIMGNTQSFTLKSFAQAGAPDPAHGQDVIERIEAICSEHQLTPGSATSFVSGAPATRAPTSRSSWASRATPCARTWSTSTRRPASRTRRSCSSSSTRGRARSADGRGKTPHPHQRRGLPTPKRQPAPSVTAVF